MSTAAHPDFLHSPATHSVHFSVTSKCNLRCVYCDVSSPGYVGTEFDFRGFKEAVEKLKLRDTLCVSFYGEGETTTIENWHEHVRTLRDAGMLVYLVSNFAKRFSDVELDALSEVHEINTSCDTVDPKAFKATRTGNVDILIRNTVALQSLCVAKFGRGHDRLFWAGVMNDLSVRHVQNWVAAGLVLGVKRFTAVQLLEKAHNDKVIPVEKMEESDFVDAIDGLIGAKRLATLGDREFEFQAGYPSVLYERLRGIDPARAATFAEVFGLAPVEESGRPGGEAARDEATAEPAAEQPRAEAASAPTLTRDCLDPWNGAFIRSNGDVNPCCYRREVWGNIHSSSVEEIFNGPVVQELRREMIAGELSGMCAICPTRATVPVEVLKEHVSEILSPRSADPEPISTGEPAQSPLEPEAAAPGPALEAAAPGQSALTQPVPPVPAMVYSERLLATIAERERRIAELENSRSWRMTAPLRNLFGWARELRS